MCCRHALPRNREARSSDASLHAHRRYGLGGRLSNFWQFLIDGLAAGSLFALIALGYTMVYGIVELINFAHGDVFMLGSCLALAMVSQLGLADGGTIETLAWWA